MDKAVSKLVGKTMGAGEKIAPVKSIKLKVKFHKPSKGKLNKAAEKKFFGSKYSK
jgi:hypothetical protein